MDKIKALETLKAIPQWVCYKNEIPKGGDKPAKMPKNPHTGYNAASTKPSQWSDFETATKAKKRFDMDGLGWVFTEKIGIVGIDLDHCIDNGVIKPWAQSIIASVHSYTEISPSGNGIHIFIYATIAKALGPAPDSNIEMYARARYFTMTGNHVEGTPKTISSRQQEVDSLWTTESKRRRENKRPKGDVAVEPVAIRRPARNTGLDSYAEKAYLSEIGDLAMATSGCRNDTLNRAAFNLGQFIGASLLSRSDVENSLLSIALQLGLSESEATKTIQSGVNGGLSNPRTNWPKDKSPERVIGKIEPKEIYCPPLSDGIDLSYHGQVASHHDFIQAKWGLTPETINEFKVGYCETCPTSTYSASFTTPYYRNDNLIDLTHRLLSPNGNGTYRPEVEGQRSNLFNVESVAGDDWAILVNREFPTMLLHQYHLPTIGLPSTFRQEWLSELSGLKRVFIALGPGMDATARKIGVVLSSGGIEARISSLPFSPKDMLIKHGCSFADFCKFIHQSWPV